MLHSFPTPAPGSALAGPCTVSVQRGNPKGRQVCAPRSMGMGTGQAQGRQPTWGAVHGQNHPVLRTPAFHPATQASGTAGDSWQLKVLPCQSQAVNPWRNRGSVTSVSLPLYKEK